MKFFFITFLFKTGENCTSKHDRSVRSLELVNTGLLLLPRSLYNSVQEIKFKVHLKGKKHWRGKKRLG